MREETSLDPGLGLLPSMVLSILLLAGSAAKLHPSAKAQQTHWGAT